MQNFVVHNVARYLSAQMHTEVKIGKVYVKLFRSVSFGDVLIRDFEQDTLIYIQEVDLKIRHYSLLDKSLDLHSIHLDNVKFNLRSEDGETSNLDFLIRYFSQSDTAKNTKSTSIFRLTSFSVSHLDFTYKLKNALSIEPYRVNYDDVEVRNLNFEINDPKVVAGKFLANLKGLNFKERSGFWVKNLDAKITCTEHSIEFQDLVLDLNKSHLMGYYGMFFHSFSDFSDFNNKVKMKGDFHQTEVHLTDVAHLAPPVMPIFDIGLKVDGRITGVVNHLKSKNIQVVLGNATYLKGDVDIKNTDDYYKMYLDIDLKQLGTNGKDLQWIMPKFLPLEARDIPQSLDVLGFINLQGKLSGKIEELNYKGLVKTDLGVLDLKFDLHANDWQQEKIAYDATFSTPMFRLENVFKGAKMSDYVTFSGKISGSNFSSNYIISNLECNLATFKYQKIKLENTGLVLQYVDKVLHYSVDSEDKYLTARVFGMMDFGKELPIYNLYADVKKIALEELGLFSSALNISGKTTIKLEGKSVDSLNGSVIMDNIRLFNKKEEKNIQNISINLRKKKDNQHWTIASEILDAEIVGKIIPSEIDDAIKKIFYVYFKDKDYRNLTLKKQNFDFRINLKNISALTTFFVPNLVIHKGGWIRGMINTEQDSLFCNANLSDFEYSGYRFNEFIFDEASVGEGFEINTSLAKITMPNGVDIHNWTLANVIRRDTMVFNLKITDKRFYNEMDINGDIVFTPNYLWIDILPSSLIIQGNEWRVNNSAMIKIQDRHLMVDKFDLIHHNQKLSIRADEGALVDNDYLVCKLENVQLNSFSSFIEKSLGVKLLGELGGTIEIQHPMERPEVELTANVKHFTIEGTDFGEFNTHCVYNTENKILEVMNTLKKEREKVMQMKGMIDVGANKLNLQVGLDKLELGFIQKNFSEYISNLSGNLSGDFKIKGSLSEPELSGTLLAKNASVKVNYLQETYFLNNQEIKLDAQKVMFNGIKLSDSQKSIAQVNGYVDFKQFLNPKFNCDIDLEKFHILNTSIKHNDLFYGQVISSGKFSLKGDFAHTIMILNISTEGGTIFNMPTFASSKVIENDFIHFTTKNQQFSNASLVQKEKITNSFSIELNLNVTEDALANIQTNLGNLSTYGAGLVAVKLDFNGNMSIFGDYTISRGKYEFAIKNQPLLRNIGKKFELQTGSILHWTGKPMEANINIKTMYPVLTQVAPLYEAAGRKLADSDPKALQQYAVNVILGLKGLLKNPDISFDIEFPTDPSIREDLNAYLTDNNRFNQAISLVVKKSFTKGGVGDFLDSRAATQIGVDYAFSQLNNIIADALGIKFLNFNSRSASDYQATLRFFDNRLEIIGGIINNATVNNTNSGANTNNFYNTSTPINYELNASYALKKDRSLTLNMFNKPSTFNLYNLNGDRYMSGAGLAYYAEFDSFQDWLQSIKRKKNKKDSLKREKK